MSQSVWAETDILFHCWGEEEGHRASIVASIDKLRCLSNKQTDQWQRKRYKQIGQLWIGDKTMTVQQRAPLTWPINRSDISSLSYCAVVSRIDDVIFWLFPYLSFGQQSATSTLTSCDCHSLSLSLSSFHSLLGNKFGGRVFFTLFAFDALSGTVLDCVLLNWFRRLVPLSFSNLVLLCLPVCLPCQLHLPCCFRHENFLFQKLHSIAKVLCENKSVQHQINALTHTG